MQRRDSRRIVSTLLASIVVCAASGVAQSNLPYVRVQGGERRAVLAGPTFERSSAHASLPAPTVFFDSVALAWHNEVVPGGGTLNPGAFFNPATITPSGTKIAFYALVNGSARNQGIFLADEQALVPIAIGCGGGGGSGNAGPGVGDPAPGGGTFSGFFGGTVFAPATNRFADLLFLADVAGGPSTRALFFYRHSTATLIKVAGVGAPSPTGGTIAALGPGSINALGEAVFLANLAPSNTGAILSWNNGVLAKVAAVGDPAPDGGVFQFLGSESFGFVDGTMIPAGPVPDINAQGQIAFRAIVSAGATSRGLIISQGGIHQWVVRAGEATPAGGTYFDFQGASINESGALAFFADFKPTPTTFSSGWFAGTSGAWRKVLAFYDPVFGGECFGLAFSRNPMSPINAHGDVVVWTDVRYPDNTMREHLVIARAEGQLALAARQGDPTPLGGHIGSIDAWPSLDDHRRATLNAGTPGANAGILSAHLRTLP